MASIDVIGEMLTIIRNANMRNKTEIALPASNLRHDIAHILLSEGFIRDFSLDRTNPKIPVLKISLKTVNKHQAIHNLKRVSKPGLRIYTKADKIPSVLNGLGIAIISTSKGLMTNKQARLENLGGEIMAYVW